MAITPAMGHPGRHPVRPVQHQVRPVPAPPRAPVAQRRAAQLQRRAGLQADHQRQHLLPLRHVIRSVGRIAQPERRDRRGGAGKDGDPRDRRQVGRAGPAPVADRIDLPDQERPTRARPIRTIRRSDILAGNYRVRGAQFGVAGHLTERWELFGGYSYNDAVVVSSPNPNEVGHAPPNAPKHTLTFFTSYVLPWHNVEIGGGAQLRLQPHREFDAGRRNHHDPARARLRDDVADGEISDHAEHQPAGQRHQRNGHLLLRPAASQPYHTWVRHGPRCSP